MTDNDIKVISEKLDNLHEKILKSKFAEIVTESEVTALILAVQAINRQKAEIERLQAEAQMADGYAEALEQKAKSEAIKEFAEKVETDLDKRVSKTIRNRNPHWYIAKRIVRETAIEMTEQSVNYESTKTDEQ